MPAFRGILNDADLAAIINHERTSWGNARPDNQRGGRGEAAKITGEAHPASFSNPVSRNC